jgi:mannosyltransferase
MRHHMNPQPRQGLDPTFWLGAVSLIGLGALLRFYKLNNQLWLDEIAALLYNYRKSFFDILTTFPGYVPQPLYELLAHASLELHGESPFAIRLPAALFGVAGVVIFYRLAHRLSSRGEALLAGALLAVSYHHIFFSQHARGYTAFLFFALWATDLLLSLFEAMRWRAALAYTAVAALTVYAHPFGLFVPAGHILVAFPVVSARQKKLNYNGPTARQLVGVAILINLVILGLYAPFIRDSIAFAVTTSTTAAEGPRLLGLLPELLEGLRAAFYGWFGVVLAGTVGLLGTLDLLRKQPLAMAALIIPFLLSVGAVSALGVGVHPRYFLLALPIGYLVGTRGIVVVGRTILATFLKLPVERIPRVQEVLGVFLVVLAALPLIRYYSMPKQDFLGALEQVRTLATQEDRVLAVDLAGHAIRDYYAPSFPTVEGLADLSREEAIGRRVWVLTTLERVMTHRHPDLVVHLRKHYRLVQVLPGSLGDGAMRIYMREAPIR